MQTRRRFKQTQSFESRLTDLIADTRAQAEAMPEGADRAALLKKVRQAETAANMERWANSPELQPPKW